MTPPKPGDRVRVTYEAEYVGYADGCHSLYTLPVGHNFHCPADATVEVLASPVYVNSDTTEYQRKDVIRDNEGDVLIRNSRVEPARWIDANGHAWLDRDVQRPLTLLVRDGKPVQP